MSPLITAKNLSKIYPFGDHEVRALDRVNIEIDTGEFVAIIGSSGSGKSTLMNILGCLDVPTSGDYFLHGKDVSAMSDLQLSRLRSEEIGFVFQSFHLIQTLNALENIELPMRYRKFSSTKRRKLAQEALEQVGLSDRAGHLPSQLSGGQQQRVAIARAVAGNPPIILADEPTGNLDHTAGEAIMRILRHQHRKGKTVILITHDPAIADTCDRVITLFDGGVESDSGNPPRTA